MLEIKSKHYAVSSKDLLYTLDLAEDVAMVIFDKQCKKIALARQVSVCDYSEIFREFLKDEREKSVPCLQVQFVGGTMWRSEFKKPVKDTKNPSLLYLKAAIEMLYEISGAEMEESHLWATCSSFAINGVRFNIEITSIQVCHRLHPNAFVVTPFSDYVSDTFLEYFLKSDFQIPKKRARAMMTQIDIDTEYEDFLAEISDPVAKKRRITLKTNACYTILCQMRTIFFNVKEGAINVISRDLWIEIFKYVCGDHLSKGEINRVCQYAYGPPNIAKKDDFLNCIYWGDWQRNILDFRGGGERIATKLDEGRMPEKSSFHKYTNSI